MSVGRVENNFRSYEVNLGCHWRSDGREFRTLTLIWTKLMPYRIRLLWTGPWCVCHSSSPKTCRQIIKVLSIHIQANFPNVLCRWSLVEKYFLIPTTYMYYNKKANTFRSSFLVLSVGLPKLKESDKMTIYKPWP